MFRWILLILEAIFLICEVVFYKKGYAELGLLFNILVVICCVLYFALFMGC